MRPMDAELEGYAWRLEVGFDTFTRIVRSTETDAEVLAGLREHGIAPPERQWFDAPAYEDELQRA